MKSAAIAWRLALAALLVTLSVCSWRMMVAFERLPTQLDWRLAIEAQETRAALLPEIDALVEEIAATRRALDTQAGQAIRLADRRLAGIEQIAQEEISQVRNDLMAEVQTLRNSLESAIGRADKLLADTDRAVQLLTPQALGLAAAAKVTAGETATTMRDWRRATPALIQGIDQVVRNSNRTTEATATVMQNFAAATKPLPRWMRVGLAVTPPLAQVAAGAATAYALTGK